MSQTLENIIKKLQSLTFVHFYWQHKVYFRNALRNCVHSHTTGVLCKKISTPYQKRNLSTTVWLCCMNKINLIFQITRTNLTWKANCPCGWVLHFLNHSIMQHLKKEIVNLKRVTDKPSGKLLILYMISYKLICAKQCCNVYLCNS